MIDIPISVVIPVKNEEINLPKCLKLLKGFNQVMVVDSGSTDQTVSIAEKFGAEVHQFKWNGQFPKKRNWTLRNLTFKNPWVLFLDADEYISEEFKEEVRSKIIDPEITGFWLHYQNYFMGKKLRHGYPMRKLALFKVGAGEYEHIEENLWSHLDMEVHEHPVLDGKVDKINAPIDHNDFKGLEHYIAKHNAYSSWEASRFMALQKNKAKNLTRAQKIKYGLIKTGMLPFFYFVGSYILMLGFLDGPHGYYLAKYKANYFFQIQTKIKELKKL